MNAIGISDIPLAQQAVVAAQVLIASIAGGIVGFERELAGKRAGLRTHMIVASASALAVGLGRIVTDNGGGDPTRVLHAVLTGVGFVGTGAVINKSKGGGGLTTAATVLLVAVLGAAAALGAPLLAVVAAVFTLIVLRGLHSVERPFIALIARRRSGDLDPHSVEDLD